MFLKWVMGVVLESSEPLFLKANGYVGTIPTQRGVYRLSEILYVLLIDFILGLFIAICMASSMTLYGFTTA